MQFCVAGSFDFFFFCFVLLFNNHIVLETKLMNVVIFQLVFVPWPFCEECNQIAFPLGPFSCALCTKWRACADCDVMGVFFESEL